MRIFLTGGTGFIGKSLVPLLRADGHEVIQLWRYTAARIPGPTDNVVWGDLKDGDLRHFVAEAQPDLIIHLAALASNHIANTYPIEAMQTIAVGTAKLVEAAEAARVNAFVLASSSEVYATPNEVGAINPYAAAKIGAEEAVKASKLNWVIARPFNTYGRGPINLPKFVVDEAIFSALTTGQVTLRDHSPIRDFLFREDHVMAYLLIVSSILAGADIYGKAFNFGTGEQHSIGEMAHMVGKLTGAIIREPEGVARPGDIPRLTAPPGGVMEIGWAPLPLSLGLAQAVREWNQTLDSLSRRNGIAPGLRAKAT